MPALNFQSQFAGAVERGEKRQTIRAIRKDGRQAAYAGDRLYHYTGMRTKACRKLGGSVCEYTQDIKIKENGTVKIDGQVLGAKGRKDLAHADGFEDASAMLAWFKKTHGFPFTGTLIVWPPRCDGGFVD